MRLVKLFSVQDLGLISCIVDTGPNSRIGLEIGIEIKLEFNQSEERKPISSLVNFALVKIQFNFNPNF